MDTDMSVSSHLDEGSSNVTCYQVIAADEAGSLHSLRFPCSSFPGPVKSEEALSVQFDTIRIDRAEADPSSSGSGRAVQRLAQGRLNDDSWVIAVGRRDGTVDVIGLDEQQQGSSSSTSVQRGRLLASIRETRMRPGMERWVGMAVGQGAVYSCTSAGAFRATFLRAVSDSTSLEVAESTELNFPSPLQDCAFHPAQNPTHFAYGGEEVPLSVWNVKMALSQPTEESPVNNGTETAGGAATPAVANENAAQMTAKERKRKRQAQARSKAKELLHGEVFRAKNLPNDALSLPQRPNITALAFAFPSASTSTAHAGSNGNETDDDSSTGQNGVPTGCWVLAGTRDGLLRLFEPGSGVRKQKAEVKLVPKGQNEGLAIKALAVVSSDAAASRRQGGQLVAYVADTSKRVYAVDWLKSRVLGQLKGITGTVNAILPLPAPGIGRHEHLKRIVTASQDRLVRLHHATSYNVVHTTVNNSDQGKGEAIAVGHSLQRLKEARLYAHAFSQAAPVTALVLDSRHFPLMTVERASGNDGDGNEERAEDADGAHGSDDAEDQEDEFLQMETIGSEGGPDGADEDEQEPAPTTKRIKLAER
ncbi:hypothetical protein K437DRAFT_294421 [Tilletiaria anomala UBC 951]|uniref:Ribosome biogenesis protein NSA1 n=1 Tax=Tilletiaria anomala (strain ATCC 24038 / CBS 436.72 / UBC 951) TaxID=1037660 RepID=A0A066W5A6_TILAU|nr:uncharacterized protein K437DRAFT_294421 [Tilletiaria anomala UBC 951]KDN45950.1 hypothetical protein K437DRAFT_294421 [Tilletiaria anomala UBC 951]